MTFKDFSSQAEIFFTKLTTELFKNNIQIEPHWNIDHICYRVENFERYSELKSSFSKFAKLLAETEVNGRAIATYKLEMPIQFNNHSIDVVELPAPKVGKKIKEGFEHIEIVSELSFDDIRNKFSQCSFDDSGLAKKLNPELEIALDGCAIKFHKLSLEEVIKIELELAF